MICNFRWTLRLIFTNLCQWFQKYPILERIRNMQYVTKKESSDLLNLFILVKYDHQLNISDFFSSCFQWYPYLQDLLPWFPFTYVSWLPFWCSGLKQPLFFTVYFLFPFSLIAWDKKVCILNCTDIFRPFLFLHGPSTWHADYNPEYTFSQSSLLELME